MAVSLVDITAHSQYSFVPIILPMHRHLTRYDFDAPWSTHYELLKSLPCLQEARICRIFAEDEPESPESPISLLHLRHLYVSDAGILEYLKAPSLVEIAIEEDDPGYLEPFLTQSSCSLRRLCIAGLPDAQATAEILQKYSSITELAIMMHSTPDTECEVLSDFFAHFTISNSTPALPQIAEIGLGCQHAIYYPLYLDMVASRWNADGCALKVVELLLPNPHPDPDPGSFARMDMLRRAGLEISLLSGHDARTRRDQWMHQASWA
ncbi:hypothetical protein B0H12DRAFT_1127041 [Mycena haematopus]|nr:hypothetical protein B0H12DRAFT_1127041 [Mycena haematopus]